jgi:predicted O-methyltransferase YrrM
MNYYRMHTSWNYFLYLLKAKHRNGHGIHSPFVYDFVRNVLFNKEPFPEYEQMFAVRQKLQTSGQRIQVIDLGATSSHFNGEGRSISQLLKHSSVNLKYSRLLFRIAHYYKPPIILELGTSIGMSTVSMALGSPTSKLITIEGNESLAAFARNLFHENKLPNIQLIQGIFDDILPNLTLEQSSPMLVFIDGNHTYEGTLKYYYHFAEKIKNGMLIFDDINWSPDMRCAWEKIKKDEKARVSIDLFRMGIVIVNYSLIAGHYIVRF